MRGAIGAWERADGNEELQEAEAKLIAAMNAPTDTDRCVRAQQLRRKNMAVMFVKEVNDCSECPYMKSERHYTADPFETVFDWVCSKNFGAIVATMEWNDSKPVIPAWCPLRSNALAQGRERPAGAEGNESK